MKYAILLKTSGELLDYCDTEEQAQYFLTHYPVELVDTDKSSKLEVVYTELGGPWGYGCSSPEFTTYGGLKRCIINLYKWIQRCARIFGPDARDVRDFLRHCSLYINGENKTQWLSKQTEKLDIHTIFG